MFLAEKKIPWPNALPASTSDLVKTRQRLSDTPTLLLLDPDGKIISRRRKGEFPLRGDALRER
jgi:hypothetical protein